MVIYNKPKRFPVRTVAIKAIQLALVVLIVFFSGVTAQDLLQDFGILPTARIARLESISYSRVQSAIAAAPTPGPTVTANLTQTPMSRELREYRLAHIEQMQLAMSQAYRQYQVQQMSQLIERAVMQAQAEREMRQAELETAYREYALARIGNQIREIHKNRLLSQLKGFALAQ